jgi:hypothetical protein
MAPDDGAEPITVGERLRRERRARFVGRTAELTLFDQLIASPRPGFSVLWLHGPGGVGKTALSDVFAERARGAGRPVIQVDARDIELTRDGLVAALGGPSAGQVTIVDTFERCAPLEAWLRERLLPGWPADGVFVIAGRHPPSAEWLGDAGWQGLLRPLPLRNLRPEESRDLLRSRGVVGERQESVIGFTHGHPLALALVAELPAAGDRWAPVRAEEEPELVRILLERFVDHVPDPRHRAALEACAHLRVTTEEVLAEVLGGDAADVFGWLRGLSFIEEGPQGLFPHDLARDVLDADLRWRNPPAYLRLHAPARAEALRRIQTTDGVRQQRALFDLVFMHRHSAVMRSYQDWDTLGTIRAVPATEPMRPEILAMVERYEGPQSTRIAERWYASQPRAFSAFLDPDGEIVGFEATVSLHDASPGDIGSDPATAAAVDFARRYGPLRPGDEMLYHRFVISRDTYQTVSTGTNLFTVATSRHWLTRPRLAWVFVAMSDPAYWQPMFTYLNFQLSDEAGFEVGRRYGVFTHDWRAEPALAWFELMEERELAVTPGPPPPASSPVALVVLSEPEFRAAVRQALRAYTRPDALAASPLLRSRVTADPPGGEPGPERLRQVLREAAETLRANPRDEKLYRALHRTYLQPAATQELAAQVLGLPFSTYRSHLVAGIDRVAGLLWQRELSGPPA